MLRVCEHCESTHYTHAREPRTVTPDVRDLILSLLFSDAGQNKPLKQMLEEWIEDQEKAGRTALSHAKPTAPRFITDILAVPLRR